MFWVPLLLYKMLGTNSEINVYNFEGTIYQIRKSERKSLLLLENCKIQKRRVNVCCDWVGLFMEFQTHRCLSRKMESISIALKFKCSS